MSLSDCEKCWNTPCTCGWDYKNYGTEALTKMRDMFQQLIDGTHMYSKKSTPETAPIKSGKTYADVLLAGENSNGLKPTKALRKQMEKANAKFLDKYPSLKKNNSLKRKPSNKR